MECKHNQIIRNYNRLYVAILFAFGLWSLIISGSLVTSVVYGQMHKKESVKIASWEISHADGLIKADISHSEQVVKAETSHVAQALIYLPQVIRTH